MPKVVVVTPIDGVEDGKIYPRLIEAGETVTGDLAREALVAGWAEEVGDDGEDAGADIVVPEGWESLPYNELRGIAAKIDPKGGAKKEEVIATISKYVAQMATGTENG